MKRYYKKIISMVIVASIVVQNGLTAGASVVSPKPETPYVSSAADDIGEKAEDFAKKLAEKGIKKAIGKIPVIGDTLQGIAAPYIKQLLGIDPGVSTDDRLREIDSKLDTLLETVNNNSQKEMEKIYLAKFDAFNEKMTVLKSKTDMYLQDIAAYEKMIEDEKEVLEEMERTTEEQQKEYEEKLFHLEQEETLLIAGLTDNDRFDQYLEDLSVISSYLSGEVLGLYEDGDIYTMAYRIYCESALQEDGCALGGEAAMLCSDYVNAINEIIDSAYTTAALMLVARNSVSANKSAYDTAQQNGQITADVSLKNFNNPNLIKYTNRYNTIKKLHYNVFGVTQEDVEQEAQANNKVSVDPGVVGRYNKMIEDRWFDYIDKVEFSGNIPVVYFTPMDGEIAFSTMADYGYDRDLLLEVDDDTAIEFCKSFTNQILGDKHSALSDDQFNKFLKHIEKSKNFKHEKKSANADYAEISLMDALKEYGFSFVGFEESQYNTADYEKFFITGAKNEDVVGAVQGYVDSYVDAYAYGISADMITEKINSKSAKKTYHYLECHYSNYKSDEKKVDTASYVMFYFKNTIKIDSTAEFKEFIMSIADGDNYDGKEIVLTDDIDLTDINYLKLWPDSKRKNEFRGIFNGNGKTISNLKLHAGEHRLGLFRTTGEGAVVQNLVMENVDIVNTADMVGYGAIAGYANGNLTIENVTVRGAITGYKYVGGFVGETKEGKYVTLTLRNCTNEANITSKEADAGGMLGNGAAIDFDGCVNRGNITATKGAAGGISGYIGNCDTDPGVSVKNCENYGIIVGYDCAGGICGNLYSDNLGAVVSGNKNYESVTVTGKRSAGGIVGLTCTGGIFSANTNCAAIENQSTNDNAHAGGILGENEDDAITMSDNVNSGRVTANKRAGGIAGTLGDKDHDKVCVLNNNTNSGAIVSKDKDAGGIIGAVVTDNRSHSISNNSNSGKIEAQRGAGGIVGWMAGGGLFESNTSRASITSIELDAGGIVGRIEDDKCDFKSSDVGNTFAGVGSYSPRASSEYDYVVHAKNSKSHAGKICGWDGDREKSISKDTLAASTFGTGNVILICVLGTILIAVAVVFVIMARRRKLQGVKKEV